MEGYRQFRTARYTPPTDNSCGKRKRGKIGKGQGRESRFALRFHGRLLGLLDKARGIAQGGQSAGQVVGRGIVRFLAQPRQCGLHIAREV